MRRRSVIKGLLGLAAAAPGFRLPLVHAQDRTHGKLFVFVQADGGWDPTSFCDPKANTPGEPVINHWAEREEIHQAGNLVYAPFAANQSFFEKYHRMMLVINGVDAQTNSHTVGIVHNWSGRNSEGYPTLGALLAAHFAPVLPAPYLSFGGFSNTSGIARYTRLDDPRHLREIADPIADMRDMLTEADWAAMASHRAATVARLSAAPKLLPGEEAHLSFYRSAFATEGLKAYADAIPPEDELEQPEEEQDIHSSLRRQAQLTVLAFKTGVAVSADLYLGGFDTHTDHDPPHEWLLGNLANSVDFLWEYAEQHGVADRLVVVIGSDFGRTNFYNSVNGKDHWPIGSFVVMEKNQPWTGRAIGETDGLHFAEKINPKTLRRDDASGTIIYPKHVHKALRKYFGVSRSVGALQFPFDNIEDFSLLQLIFFAPMPNKVGRYDKDKRSPFFMMMPEVEAIYKQLLRLRCQRVEDERFDSGW